MHFPDYYHIGIMKSGTTTLQYILQQDPRLNLIVYSRFFNTNKFYTSTYNYATTAKINIESDENMCMQHGNMYGLRTTLKHIKSVNPNAKIIVTIREQQAALYSMYKHYVRQSSCATKNFYQFLQSPTGISFLNTLDYNLMFDTINLFFAKENIYFLPFELLKSDASAFLNFFYEEILNISPPPLPEIPIKNDGINLCQLKYKLILNRLQRFKKNTILYRLMNYLIQGTFFRTKFLFSKSADNKNADFLIPDKMIKEFQHSNTLFEQKTSINLSKWGYLIK